MNDCVHFYGGGFKTLCYLNYVKQLIGQSEMPRFYSGTSSGALVACLCLALSSISNIDERKIALGRAIIIIKNDIIIATNSMYKNLIKCQTSVDVIINICRAIQPDIDKYNNKLNVNITRLFKPHCINHVNGIIGMI